MTTPPHPTALVGFGNIGVGYASDTAMAKYYRYTTHAQVLKAHPGIDWRAVVEPNASQQDIARADWDIPCVASSAADLKQDAEEIEIVILATPPETRLSILDHFPNAKAVLVEKPLGTCLNTSQDFIQYCENRGIKLQVNLWRRADQVFRQLASGGLNDRIGQVQNATGYYGNGLMNNGTHLIDFAQMLFGNIKSVRAFPGLALDGAIVIEGDSNPFSLPSLKVT